MTSDRALRNRAIRRILAKHYDCKVRVRSGRGTERAWVTIEIDRPNPGAGGDFFSENAKIVQLLADRGVELSHYLAENDEMRPKMLVRFWGAK